MLLQFDLQRSYGQSNLINQGCKERAINLNSNPLRVPKSPWIPFPMLFAAIANKVSADDMKVIYAHYGSYMVCLLGSFSCLGNFFVHHFLTYSDRNFLFFYAYLNMPGQKNCSC